MDILTYKLNDIKVIEIVSARVIKFNAEDVLNFLKNTYFCAFDCIILHRINLADDFFSESGKIPERTDWKKPENQVKIVIVGNHAEPIRGIEQFIKELALPEKIIFADTPFQALEKVKA